jgi:hypothetical protein
MPAAAALDVIRVDGAGRRSQRRCPPVRRSRVDRRCAGTRRHRDRRRTGARDR